MKKIYCIENRITEKIDCNHIHNYERVLYFSSKLNRNIHFKMMLEITGAKFEYKVFRYFEGSDIECVLSTYEIEASTPTAKQIKEFINI
ncbi:MAG: hypothetical protein ACRC0V_01605 [Fusobacteriaceae bacterium]